MSTSKQYAIAVLVADRCIALQLSRSDLVRRTGYASPSKGLRRLDQLFGGDLDRTAHLIAALPVALEISSELVHSAVEETRTELSQELESARQAQDAAWRATFQPHCVIVPERKIPQPIFVAAFVGVENLLRVDLNSKASPETYVAQSIDGIRKRLAEFNSKRIVRESLPAFGRPVGFIVNYAPDRAVRYSLDGEPLEFLSKAERLGQAWMEFR